jgi:hypothetical protein
MKILAMLLVLGSVSIAHAAEDNSDILKNPVLVSVEQILNSKHNDQCKLPSTSADIHWMCTGAMFTPSSPEIDYRGCGFMVQIVCPGETVRVIGNKGHEVYDTPQDAGGSASTNDSVSISDISVENK